MNKLLNDLSHSEKKRLLRLAREVLEAKLKGQKLPMPSDFSPALCKPGSCFVSLHQANELRGCIGNLQATGPLYENVAANTINAALKDPRFAPLQPEEMANTVIEISVLTPPRQITSINKFIIGKHGIILEHGQNRAVFLPQVAIQQGWERETTLVFLTRKAGLHEQAWRDPEARLQVFEAIVFSEE